VPKKRLMYTTREVPEPTARKQALPASFTHLYNFLLHNCTANDLHVDAAAIPLLATLTQAVRDLFQLAQSRIDPKEFPVSFQHKFVRYLK
jgi:hypothetical protein